MSDYQYYRIGVPNYIVPDVAWHDEFTVEPERTCTMSMVFEDDEGHELDGAPAYYRHYRCSNCKEIMEHYKYDYWFYCPNCGAKVIASD